MSGFSAVVLAGGLGRRMQSSRPKPLHPVCGKPMILHGIEQVAEAGADRIIVVIGDDGDEIVDCVSSAGPEVRYDFVRQSVARGSADAALLGCEVLSGDGLSFDVDDDDVIVMPSDVPLIRSDVYGRLITHQRATEAAATLISGRNEETADHSVVERGGRGDRVTAIVDREDTAHVSMPASAELASGVYCFRRELLMPALRRIRPDNPQGSLLLGDVIEVLVSTGHLVESIEADPATVIGVNDRFELAAVESTIRRRTNETWLRAGVTMVDPDRTYIDSTVEIGADTELMPGVMLHGNTVIGEGATIGPDVQLVDTVVEDGATVERTVATGAFVGAGATVGPFAVLPEGDRVPRGVDTGPFISGVSRISG